MESWVILGASSSMARAFARAVSEQGHQVFLLGRDKDDLGALAEDCRLRGAPLAEVIGFDARKPAGFGAILSRVDAEEGLLNAAVFVGSMPDQAEIDAEPSMIAGVVTDSHTGPAQFLHEMAPLMEARKGGTVVGISSVAGDRGRISNYVYGAAKAAFSTYLAGLRNRLTRVGGHVVTVKPGFTDTGMTWGIEGMFLVASPEATAARILKAVEKKRNVIYAPGFWWLIMTIIRHIPEPVFKKMSI